MKGGRSTKTGPGQDVEADERSYPSTFSDDQAGKSSGVVSEEGNYYNKKRDAAGSEISASEDGNEYCVDIDDKNKNRGNYRCGRCNLPKKGHICPFQPVLKPRDHAQLPELKRDMSSQAEIDHDMTVAALGNLDEQGTVDSYMRVYPKIRRVTTIPT